MCGQNRYKMYCSRTYPFDELLAAEGGSGWLGAGYELVK